jgi:non-specific serine/threonine protein kinase
LIGRDAEVAAVCELLATSRLVALTGPGGIGKTQLALAVAARLVERFSDGAAFIELAAVDDHRQVVPTIAAALGLRESGAEPIGKRLRSFLRDGHILLILDNVEHLLLAATDVADLLGDCPRLHLLVTSRAPLRLRGEQTFDVQPLATPHGRLGLPHEQVARYPAVELFVRQAQASDATFVLTEANAGTIAAICNRLDGLPLAIELAAPRIRMLTPNDVLERLNDQLQLLTGGPRDLPPRLQTMRGAIAWSYELLDVGQQALFRRLAEFSGGWTLATAGAVCLPDEDVLEAMTALHACSLVRRVTQPVDEARYSMLEPIRQFALEHLLASGEREAVRARHAEVFLELAEQAAPHLDWRDQPAWMTRLDREHDNVRAALSWLIEQRDAERGLRFVAALSWFWNMRGLFVEAWTQAQAVLNLPQAGERTQAHARALGAVAHLLYFLGDYAQGRALAEEALALNAEVGDRAGRARILIPLAVIAFDSGDDARHALLAEDLLTTARSLGDQENIARALARLGLAALRNGNTEQALTLFTESLELAQRLENRATTALALGCLGDAHLQSGELACAAAVYRESLAIYVELDYRSAVVRGLARLAALACARTQWQRSARLYAVAEARRAAISGALSIPERATYNDDLAAIQAGLTDAQFQSAWSSGQVLPDAAAIAYALETSAAPNVTQPAAVAGLTPRELEVLRLIAAGQSNKQIAAELYLSIRTVERHITNLYTKIGARGKADATAWALRHELA